MKHLLTLIALLFILTASYAQPPTPILFTTDTAWTSASGAPLPFGCWIQIICAGPDTTIQPPDFDLNFSAPTGDDFIVTTDTIGAGCPPIPPFYGIFNIGSMVYANPTGNQLGIGYRVYARVWNAAHPANATFYYDSRLHQTTGGGETANLLQRHSYTVSVEESERSNTIKTFEMKPMFPNPTNSATTIRYSLPTASTVELVVYDVQGRLVHSVFLGKQNAEQHLYHWNMSQLASGTYFVRLRVNNVEAGMQRITLIR
ncbi:MAG: T9SS type A sorting domain-containing protein [bacterium]|nr:T9SS type A sorting domain-containing protein [bacterium]